MALARGYLLLREWLLNTSKSEFMASQNAAVTHFDLASLIVKIYILDRTPWHDLPSPHIATVFDFATCVLRTCGPSCNTCTSLSPTWKEGWATETFRCLIKDWSLEPWSHIKHIQSRPHSHMIRIASTVSVLRWVTFIRPLVKKYPIVCFHFSHRPHTMNTDAWLTMLGWVV